MRASMPSSRVARGQPYRSRESGARCTMPRRRSGCDDLAGIWPGRPAPDPVATGLNCKLCVRSLSADLGVRARLELPAQRIRQTKKIEAAGASAPGGLKQGSEAAYADFIVPVTVLKVALICEPSPRAAAMMPTAIRAAMRPYSMAVAPDSSFTKRSTWFFMTTLPTHSLHEASAVVHP